MSFFNAGKSGLKWEVIAGNPDSRESSVVLRGNDGHYPLIGIHLTREEAEELARQIVVVLEGGDA